MTDLTFQFKADIIADRLKNTTLVVDLSAGRNCFASLNKLENRVEHFDKVSFKQLVNTIALEEINQSCLLSNNEIEEIKAKMITVNEIIYDLTMSEGLIKKNGRIIFNYIQETELMKQVREINSKREKQDYYDCIDFNKYKHIEFVLDNLINEENNIATDKYGKKVNLKKFVINWIAHTIQMRAKIGTSIVFISPMQGTGKSFFCDEIYGKFFGQYYATVDNNTFTELHNGLIDNKLFLMFDEGNIPSELRDKVAAKLKVAISQENMTVRKMRTEQENKRSIFNMIINTNEKIPFKIDRNDRRYTCLKTKNERLDIAVMKKLNIGMTEFIKNFRSEVLDFIADLDNLILNSDMIKFNALMTETKKNIIRATNTKINSIIDSINNQDFEELRNYLYDCDNQDLLEDFLEQVKYGFLTNEIVNKFLHLNLKESDKNLKFFNKSNARQYWDNRIGQAVSVGYTQNGQKKSQFVRKLDNFDKEGFEYYFSEERKIELERMKEAAKNNFKDFYEED